MLILNLRTKILLSTGFIILIALGTSTIFHIQNLKRNYLEALQWRSEALAQILIPKVIELHGYDTKTQRILGLAVECDKLYESHKAKNVIQVGVINESGTIAAHNDEELWDSPIESSALIRSLQNHEQAMILDGAVYHTLVPVFDSQVKYLGTIIIGIPKDAIDTKARQLIYQAIELFVLFGGLAFVVISGLIHFVVTKPIRRLVVIGRKISHGELLDTALDETSDTVSRRKQKTSSDEIEILTEVFHEMIAYLKDMADAATRIANGDFSQEVAPRSNGDELGLAFQGMTTYLKDILQEIERLIEAIQHGKLTVRGNVGQFSGDWQKLVIGVNDLIHNLSESVSRSVALSQEMELARKIQTSLLPDMTDSIHPDFEISAVMVTADEVGGDFYEVTSDRSDNLWFAIGDVSGHGVTPGLIMMMAQTIHLTVTTNLDCDARGVVVKINEILYKNVHERLKESHFMTFNALKYKGEGKFEHAGAHLRIIVFRQKSGQCELIRTKGVYLNFKQDISKSTSNSYFEMGKGDIMVLYTDGLTEAENPEGEMLDIDGFVEIIGKHVSYDPETMKENIMADVLKWCDNKKGDDMTLVIVKRKGCSDG
ncbi:SpoIIE family protein phosphatase [Desulfococcaceae bacterium HSG7]|nr:SpoIIE family protein phosphatase [Desulfococcaceae bacterium HSG7]